MWHKSDGSGVLEGAEARLLKVAVAAYVEHLREHNCWDNPQHPAEADEVRESWLSVVQVQRMEHGQRLHMIATITRALLERSILAPELTADSEATVYQIYQFLCVATEIESDMLEDMEDCDLTPESRCLLMSTRLAIAAAAQELDEPKPSEPDMDAGVDDWRGLVETLADNVLWDRDWEIENAVADAHPDTGTAAKTMVGIEEGYFTIPAEEPTPLQVMQAKSYLESIADEIRAEV